MEPENYRLGIDVGGTNTRAGVVHDSKVVSEIIENSTPDNLDDFLDMVKSIIDHFAVDDRGCIGMAIPGMVDYDKQRVMFCPNLRYLNNQDLGKLLNHDKLQIGNDADFTLLGEIANGNLWNDNLGVVTLGTGIGSAYYVNKIGPWQSNLSCEIGHTKVVADGLSCTCGQAGCLEAYFSGWSLMRSAFKEGLEFKSVEELFDSARTGNVKTQFVLEEGVKYLSLAIANLINISGVNEIIIGGKIAYSYDLIEKQLQLNLKSFVHQYDERNIKVWRSTLVDQASLIGAAEIFLQTKQK